MGRQIQSAPVDQKLRCSFLIEFVHPFEDGNGRMGRIWQTVILVDWHPAFRWIPVETMTHQNQHGYFDHIDLAKMT